MNNWRLEPQEGWLKSKLVGLRAVEDVISQLLSYVDWIIYPREFASVIDYIIVKKGVVPRPIYVGSSLPINYANLSRFDFKMPWEKIWWVNNASSCVAIWIYPWYNGCIKIRESWGTEYVHNTPKEVINAEYFGYLKKIYRQGPSSKSKADIG